MHSHLTTGITIDFARCHVSCLSVSSCSSTKCLIGTCEWPEEAIASIPCNQQPIDEFMALSNREKQKRLYHLRYFSHWRTCRQPWQTLPSVFMFEKKEKKKCRRSWEFKVRVSERGGETLPVWWTPRRCKSASVSASSSVRNVASNWTKRCPVYRKKKQWGTVSHIGVYLGEKTGHRTGKLTHRYAIREPADDRLRFAKVELKAFNCQLFVRADWD